MHRLLLAVVALVALVAPIADANTLVFYDFPTNNVTNVTSPKWVPDSAQTDSQIVASNFLIGYLTPVSYLDVLLIRTKGTWTPVANVISRNAYVQFTVAPADGHLVSLTDLTFLITKTASTAASMCYSLRSSVDSFTADIAQACVTTYYSAVPSYTTVTVDLSGAVYQKMLDPITLRLYLASATTNVGFNMDKFALNGNVVLPDPSPEPSASPVPSQSPPDQCTLKQMAAPANFMTWKSPDVPACDVFKAAQKLEAYGCTKQDGCGLIMCSQPVPSEVLAVLGSPECMRM